MARLILDALGGDRAPHAMLEGAIEALPELCISPDGERNELILVGDEAIIRPLLEKRRLRPLKQALANGGLPGCSIRLVQASETISMDDSIRAIRRKPNASINVGCQMAGESYRTRSTPTALISAGHSGAVMASALLNMGRLASVERPAIAIKLPTLSPDGCVLLDVGANVDCKPEHLRDFAIMGAIFGMVERKSKDLPRVGLLSNGEERTKGNELTKAAFELIERLPCFKGDEAIGKFLGNVEGKEFFKGQVDVVVTDGFVGNVVLKSVEGLGSAVVTILKREAKSSLLTPLGFLLAAPAFRRLKKKLDYAEYGAAPLLGVAGYAFICHGRSNPRAIKNALLRAQSALNGRYVERLEAALLSAVEQPNGGSAQS